MLGKTKKIKYNLKYNSYIMNIMTINVKTRKWGSSIGIVIPSEEAAKLNLKENEEIIAEIRKKENPLKELFGSIETRKTAEDIIAETRKELESKWM
jgi:antitoxin component of MazEF toxin-antitoxin module